MGCQFESFRPSQITQQNRCEMKPDGFNTVINTDFLGTKSRCSPTAQYLFGGDMIMGRRAKPSLYRLFTVDGKHRYVPIVRKGGSWDRKWKSPGGRVPIYLRYLKNGSRTFASVGDDLQVALQELKARQASLSAPTRANIFRRQAASRLCVHVGPDVSSIQSLL